MGKHKLTLQEIKEKIYKFYPNNKEKGDWKEFIKYNLIGAQMGDGECMVNIGLCYEHGNGLEQSNIRALYWIKKGVACGDNLALCTLARYYENGDIVECDLEKALMYYRKAGDNGYGLGYANSACMYADGRGCEHNYSEAFKLWSKAYDMGEEWVAKYLCECYLLGRGVKKDIEKARYYMEIAKKNKDYDVYIDEEIETGNIELLKEKLAKEKHKCGKDCTINFKKEVKYDSEFVLAGREALTKFFNEEIIDFFRHRDDYEEMGIHTVSATLLYGPSGCGKTYAVNEVARYLKLPVFEINSSTVADAYVHGMAINIAKMFERARAAAPSVLIIDEFETYVGKRSQDDWKSKIEETDEFLRNIGPAIDDNVIIFAMTNMPKVIDPAILRRGRFDNKIEVGPASEKEIIAVLTHELKKTKVEDNVDLTSVAKKLAGHPLSDIGYLVKHSIRVAVRSGRHIVLQEDINAALEQMLKDKKFGNVHTCRHIGFRTA